MHHQNPNTYHQFTFAKATRDLRNECNLSQKMLADRAGISLSSVQNIECGYRENMNLTTFTRVYQTLLNSPSIWLPSDPNWQLYPTLFYVAADFSERMKKYQAIDYPWF